MVLEHSNSHEDVVETLNVLVDHEGGDGGLHVLNLVSSSVVQVVDLVIQCVNSCSPDQLS